MGTRLANLWDRVRTGFWFLPGLMGVAAVAAGFILPRIDAALPIAEDVPALKTTPAAAGRTLSAFGGAIVTASGVVFSTTVVVLSLASQQFGPRLLRTFLADRATQVTLGAFVGTSLYCLLVMRVIREVEGNPVAPDLSVAVATLASVLTLGQLVYFIHHISVRIQAPVVIRAVASDLDGAIDRLFPDRIGRDEAEAAETRPDVPAGEAARVAATSDGYLQSVDDDRLMNAAVDRDVVLELPFRPGDFVAKGDPLVLVRAETCIDDEFARQLRDKFILGSRATPRQDVECSIAELVEVAVRALSPGINDPFTAMSCLDYLGAALGRLAGRRMPSPTRYDDAGRLRVVARPPSFRSALDMAFDQIRQYARNNPDVTIRLLEALARVARRAATPEQRAEVRRHAEMCLAASETWPEGNDRGDARERFDRVVAVLDGCDVGPQSRPAQESPLAASGVAL